MKKFIHVLSITLIVAGCIATTSCEVSEPAVRSRQGDTLNFAGREWVIKHNDALLGPGPNIFTNHPSHVWVDNNGYLHLTIDEREGTWYSTEVVSKENMGYGTYVFTIQGDPVNIDENVVLGLFTWDNNTFQQEANSEVDIEFAKWGEPEEGYTLQYGVQPINFGPYYPERVDKPVVDSSQWIGVSTHAFTWTDTLITWKSWPGSEYDNGTPTASWNFDLNNPARIKNEGQNSSRPIIIPAPGETTNARMNFWLLEGPSGPANQERHEMIIRNFQYLPL